jgi:hypothetical protein
MKSPENEQRVKVRIKKRHRRRIWMKQFVENQVSGQSRTGRVSGLGERAQFQAVAKKTPKVIGKQGRKDAMRRSQEPCHKEKRSMVLEIWNKSLAEKARPRDRRGPARSCRRVLLQVILIALTSLLTSGVSFVFPEDDLPSCQRRQRSLSSASFIPDDHFL